MRYIYKITNNINKKIYIGQTNDVVARYYKHVFLTKKGVKRHLYNAMRYYGVENFYVETIEACDEQIANEREKYWIAYYKTTDKRFGYNKTDGGIGASTWKYNDHKEQTRALLSEKLKGHPVNCDAMHAIADRRKGSHLSEEQRYAISKTLKEKYSRGELTPHPPPHYDVTGTHHSDTSRAKISASKKGKSYEEIYSPEEAIRRRLALSERWTGIGNPNYKNINVSKIIELIETGFQNQEIAKMLGVSAQTVWYKLKSSGLNATEIRRGVK